MSNQRSHRPTHSHAARLALTLLLSVALLASACEQAPLALNTATPALIATPVPALAQTDQAAATPAALSALIGDFTRQNDGTCGYRFLRPAAWTAPGPDCMLRQYVWARPSSSADQLALIANNYRVLAQQPGTANIAQYEAFQADSTLDGWMRLIEAQWANNYITLTLSTTLPQARVYALARGVCDCVLLAGFKLDQGQPLALSLWAYGAYASLDRLRAEHLWDDFLTMLGSLQAATPTAASATPTLDAIDTAQTTVPLTAVPTLAPTMPPAPLSGDPLEIHQTFSNGLTVDEYALTGEPTLDPLNFTTVHSTRADIVAHHFKDGGAVPFYNFGFDAQGPTISTVWRGQNLTAHEIYTNQTPGIINVLHADQLLYTLPIGHGGPLNALQQLLTFDDHWFLGICSQG